MDHQHLPEYVRYLLKSSSYPHPAKQVELVQTHISYVILAGDYVYKWKKPVNFGFLDFSSLHKRKFFCEEEVRLNRRLCPKIYLDVVPIAREKAGFRLAGSGEPVEYGVKMLRLPEERMMTRVIAAGRLQKSHLERIVELLVPFYAAADDESRIAEYGRLKAVRKTMDDNFTETRKFVGGAALSAERYARIRKFTDMFLRKNDLFEQRVNHRRVRECHGDLHSANICLTDEVDIFDCIEFNESLRCTDVAADVAFLAMDLDFHGLHELSDFFIQRFVACSRDEELLDMLDFYKCYRAYVRGKIGLLTAADPAVDRDVAARSLADAARYFRLAEHYGAQ